MANYLPSWNDGKTKEAILNYVASVTDPNQATFVPVEERIAVFDNDGTLWSERPLYFQGLFAFGRIREMAAEHPEWREEYPFSVVLSDDPAQVAALKTEDFLKIIEATHTGMTAREFRELVADWIMAARHPRFGVPYTEVVFQPMLEAVSYTHLRAHET